MRTIPELQQFLGVKDDGIFGPKSQAALDAILLAEEGGNVQRPTSNVQRPIEEDPVDPRSELNIRTLLEPVQPLARALIRKAAAQGIVAKVTSGYRTYEEQADLRRKYDAGGPKAAPAGYSNHNFALAFDVTVFDASGHSPIWDGPAYPKLGAIGKELGLFWGGDWQGRDEDQPHFEYRPLWATHVDESHMIAELRRRHVNGINVV